MIKGINRSIIEVIDTGSLYYERALLVIKPEYACAQRDILEKEAKKLIENMGEPSSLKRGNKRLKTILTLCAAAVFGALFTAIFLSLV